MGLYKVWEGEGRKDSTQGVSTGEKELIYFLKKNSGLYAIFWHINSSLHYAYFAISEVGLEVKKGRRGCSLSKIKCVSLSRKQLVTSDYRSIYHSHFIFQSHNL